MIELSRIAQIINQFEKEEEIVVTEKARLQLFDLINCVQVDPHETWNPDFYLLKNYYAQWQERLPGILRQIKYDHHLKSSMTTMDVVFWTGRNLPNHKLWHGMCPFPPSDPGGPLMHVFPWNV